MIENELKLELAQDNKDKITVIFDLDGTLYRLRGASYSNSPLRRAVLRKARLFIARRLRLSPSRADKVLSAIQKEYGEDISIALEKKYGIDRSDYFETVWNLPARGLVRKNLYIRPLLFRLQKKYRLALVSEAPLVWIKHVLEELGISDIFQDQIFSGEGNNRKGFGNAFSQITKMLKVKPIDCISVGDQEKTDIIPAKKIGMKAIYINSKDISPVADANIRDISELEETILTLTSNH